MKDKKTRKLNVNLIGKHYELQPGDEYFLNGIFKFHITKLNEYIDEYIEEFKVEVINVNEYFRCFCNEELNSKYVEAADLNRPIILAEISPDRLFHGYPTISDKYYSRGYNLIDGHHRLAKAKQIGREKLSAYVVRMEQHIPFMVEGFEQYVEYWNSKLE